MDAIPVFNGTLAQVLGPCQVRYNTYSAECIYQQYCGQFSSYFINTGIAVIVVYIFSGWFLWWFMNHGYKMVDWDDIYKNQWIRYLSMGDMRNLETRLYWDACVRDLVAKFAVGFAAVVVFLSIWH
jgi:hypothetical protein